MRATKYRIVSNGKKWLIEEKGLFFWSGVDQSGECVGWVVDYYDSLEEAKEVYCRLLKPVPKWRALK